MMDMFESINAGVVNSKKKVKAGGAEGRLDGGQLHNGWGEEFMLECSRGPGSLRLHTVI